MTRAATAGGAAEADVSALLVALREEAAMWLFLHDLFRLPSPEQWDWLRDEPARAAWRALSGGVGTCVPSLLPVPNDYTDFEASYLSAFEVGVPQPKCPLIEAHWNRRVNAPEVLRENLLYFRRFGLEVRERADPPLDHLLRQLEFLHYLCRLEADARERGGAEVTADQIAQAREEYHERHPGYWVPRAAASLAREAPDEWPSAWMDLLAAWVAPTG